MSKSARIDAPDILQHGVIRKIERSGGYARFSMPRDPYRNSAKRYDRYVEPLLAGLRRIGLRLYRPRKGMQVLDVGCGTGTTLQFYLDAGCRVSGIDFSPAMAAATRQKLGQRACICQGDGARMPYPAKIFDLVSGWMTLHEMSNAVRIAVLDEMVRVTKDSGRILLVDYRAGPVRPISGRLFRLPILFFEIIAGRDHFRHYRDFLCRNGLGPLVSKAQLIIEREETAVGGNIVLTLLRPVPSVKNT
ncbi:MAG: methyltransferase domain-containing protein [Deltaproteobacteria bacterium]|nr:methyltransferase domain-containing protein [Deltaproteobacteria bacterium]